MQPQVVLPPVKNPMEILHRHFVVIC